MELPPWTPADDARAAAVYLLARLHFPQFRLDAAQVRLHLQRTFALYRPKHPGPLTWSDYIDGLYALDWIVCIGCLERQEAAWEALFAARTQRADLLLIDALRLRAARFYPHDADAQESAVQEFWSRLLVPETDDRLPILGRYDGRRPLVPWLIRVFQNWHISRLRRLPDVPLPEDDHAVPPAPPPPPHAEARWHELFVQIARDWIGTLSPDDLLLLGLRWRYRMNQRQAAKLFGLNEGTLTRRTDKLRDRALAYFGERLAAAGWSGDDLMPLILAELGEVLSDDPRLSAEQLRRLLAQRHAPLPPADPEAAA